MYQPENPVSIIRDQKAFAKVGRRELLKIAPLLLAGAMAVPKAARLFANLIAIRPISARLSAFRSFGSIGMFLIILTFVAPCVWQQGYDLPLLSPLCRFMLKDLVLLGAAICTTVEFLPGVRNQHKRSIPSLPPSSQVSRISEI